jgi:hypothetical protein
LFTAHNAKISWFKIKSFFKFFTALHVSAYTAIIGGVEIRGELLCLQRYFDPRLRIYKGKVAMKAYGEVDV